MKESGYRFPWRDGNQFRLLIDGRKFFPAMLDAIADARHCILLEMYLVESGRVATRFIEALLEARRRGVRVFVLFDHYGASELSRQDRQRLIGAGVDLTFYNPISYGRFRRNLFRDHRKLLVVDGHTAYVGGAGLTDDFDPADRHGLAWHEVMTEIRGPCVADWHNLFRQNYVRWGRERMELPAPEAAALPAGSPGRVVMNSPTRPEVKRSLLKRIRSARSRIWLVTAYFIPSHKVRRALHRAAHRGVDVRLLLPGPHTDLPPVRHAGRRYYGRLLRHGVRIFEYQPRFLHAKLLICDEWVSTGSSNIDRWNFTWNLEANQEASDPALTRAAMALVERDLLESREYTSEQWFARPWYRRLQEWFWGSVDLWMDRFSRGKRRDMP